MFIITYNENLDTLAIQFGIWHDGVHEVVVCVCVQAGQGAGMLSVAVPPALSARGRFPAADATFDGFGYGGGLNWPRLQMLLDKRQAGKV